MRYYHKHHCRQLNLLAAALALAVALPLMPLSTQAQPEVNPDNPSARGVESGLDLLIELGLSDEQLLEIMSLRRQSRAAHQDRREELRQAQQQLQDLLAGTAPEEEVRSQFERVQSMRQELASEQFEHLMAIREVLEPEQRSMLTHRLGGRRDRWRRWRRGGRWNRGVDERGGWDELEEDV